MDFSKFIQNLFQNGNKMNPTPKKKKEKKKSIMICCL